MTKIVECVPNFSEGKDQEKIDKILAALKSVTGCNLVDWEKDAGHNRCVITIAGEPDAVKQAVYKGVAVATQLLDLNFHKGEHPRFGATDVIPFIPISDMTMDECIIMAKEVGAEIAKRFNIPVYLYDKAAQIPGREKLPNVRNIGFEGLREAIQKDPSRKPDFPALAHPNEIHPTAGAVAVGARAILVAFNVYLNTIDVEIVKEIAKLIRESNGGFRSVRAKGFDTKPFVQVSMNMVDFKDTPLHITFETIKLLAARFGVNVIGSEIVGMIPRDAMLDAAEFYLQLTGPGKPWPLFKREQILENKLEQNTKVSLNLLSDLSVRKFIAELASDSPAPGGGSAAALTGTQGAALICMVANLTVNKPESKEYQNLCKEVLDVATKGVEFLIKQIDNDANAFNAVIAGFKMPKTTDTEKNARTKAIKDGYRVAVEVPLETARKCYQLLDQAEKMAKVGNPQAISDIGVGALSLHAGFHGSLLNVRINLKSKWIKDEQQDFANKINTEIEGMEKEIDNRLSAILKVVNERL